MLIVNHRWKVRHENTDNRWFYSCIYGMLRYILIYLDRAGGYSINLSCIELINSIFMSIGGQWISLFFCMFRYMEYKVN